MTNIKDIPSALSIFEESAMKHAEASRQGDFKTGNKNYDKILKAVAYLKEQNGLDELLPYINHQVVGVRVAAATFLLPNHEELAIKVLDEVSKSSDFLSFIAETTLSEWQNGNLKL